MARPKKKPAHDAEKIMKELMAAVVECYDETGDLKLTAKEFGMSALKIKKLLITAGAYSNEISDEVNDLYAAGKTVAEIQKLTGLGKSSVNGYLPYTKAVYKPEELSLNAERINMFRSRQQAVRRLATDMSEEKLWDAEKGGQRVGKRYGRSFVPGPKRRGSYRPDGAYRGNRRSCGPDCGKSLRAFFHENHLLAHMTPFLQNRHSGIDFWIIMDYNEISEQFTAFFVQNDKSHT